MAKNRKFDIYHNEYKPSWVTHQEEVRAKQIKEADDWLEKNEKNKPKNNNNNNKRNSKNKPIKKHKGKNSNKKFYAIKKGKKSNVIVDSWSKCSNLVIGYKGAIYKGFSTKEEAKRFINK